MGKKKIAGKEEKSLILPLFALEHFVMTPMIPQPIKIDDEVQRAFIDSCSDGKSHIFVVGYHKDEDTGDKEIMGVGVVCIIDRLLQMPGAPSLAFVRPICRAIYDGPVIPAVTNDSKGGKDSGLPGLPMARLTPLPDVSNPKRMSSENKLILERVDVLIQNLLQFAGDNERATALKLIEENSYSEVSHLYSVAHVAPLDFEEKSRILECDTYKELLETVAIALDQSEQKINIQAAIHEKTHREINRQQKENFLRIHLKQIKEELGEDIESDDIDALTIKAEKKKWPATAKEHFNKELKKLRRLNINNPDYSVQYSYLEALLELPWNNYSKKPFTIENVENTLNRDHYGLENVKERILEYMAVVKLRNDLKAPIICLYGPPGVGKTSIGKSVAEALGREYIRIALGGVHDEAEIRGHRKTYIGAMPGRIMHSLSKCKFGNPLMLLDEIDKVGKDYKGDPASALLEALDPEQNHTFHDNYIDVPYDLSKVLFLATANDISTIPAPLLDRMEIIEMPRYSIDEKKEIALRHLVAKALEDNGFKKGEIEFTPEAVNYIINRHTQEAGVRQLAKKISAILRKMALKKVKGEKISKVVSEKTAAELIGNDKASRSSLGFRL